MKATVTKPSNSNEEECNDLFLDDPESKLLIFLIDDYLDQYKTLTDKEDKIQCLAKINKYRRRLFAKRLSLFE